MYPRSDSQLFVWWACLFLGTLVFVVVFARVVAWLHSHQVRHKLLRNHTVIAEYTPPGDLAPYELGYLYDNVFAENEIFAAILQMAQKNLVDVDLSKAENFSMTAATISTEERLAMLEPEKAIYDALIEKYGTHTTWHSVVNESSQVGGIQSDFEDMVLQGLQQKGYLHQGAILQSLDERRFIVRIVSFLLSGLMVFLPLRYVHTATERVDTSAGFQSLDQGVLVLALALVALLAWPLIYLYCSIVAHVYFRAAGYPVGSTPQLRAIWPRIVGHRLFVETVDWPKMKETVDLADQLLPYCAAYGLYKVPTNELTVED